MLGRISTFSTLDSTEASRAAQRWKTLFSLFQGTKHCTGDAEGKLSMLTRSVVKNSSTLERVMVKLILSEAKLRLYLVCSKL